MKPSPLRAFAVGALGGALVGFGVWWWASRTLDRRFQAGSAELAADLGVGAQQLRAELAAGRERLRAEVVTQVQAHVPDVLDERLALYGVTPELVRQVARVIDYGRRAGAL